ncbi:hypothetical protein BY458DRAFT_496542 [Sporodiniella umbellata]|nr:hypothetical protein BY458DRAFT_496542 [Sporodiniella umbellata]
MFMFYVILYILLLFLCSRYYTTIVAHKARDKDPTLCKDIKTAINELRKEGKEWDFLEVASSSYNTEVSDSILQRVLTIRNNHTKKFHEAEYERWAIRCSIYKKFNNTKFYRPAISSATTSPKESPQMKVNRRNKKLRAVARRKNALNLCTSEELNNFKGGEKLIEVHYTSDEDRGFDNSREIIVRRPSWRSSQANEFLDMLDMKNPRRRRHQKNRSFVVVEVPLKKRDKDCLPHWAYV